MAPTEATMREVYARYFFSLFDANLHHDEVGLQLAQQHLEDFLVARSALGGAPATP